MLEVSFGGAGSVIGSLAAAAGRTASGEASADLWKRSVAALTLESGFAPEVDSVEIYLSEEPQAVAVGDAGSVSLGYEDEGTLPVFTGQVESVQRRVAGTTHITATNGGAVLSRLQVNQSYEQQKAGDIVRDLAGRAGVEVGTLEDGYELPFCVVDDRRSAYAHLAELARKNGYLAYVASDGGLVFAPFANGEAVKTFRYGVDVLALEVMEGAPGMGAVTTWGEGAAGSQGREAWSWLVKDPASVTGNSGEGAPERWFADRSLRSADAVGAAAEGIAGAASMLRLLGKMLVPGAAAVTVGSAVEVTDAPQAAMNGKYLVRGVRHLYGKREGFRTEILFSAAESGLGGSELLGAVGGLL